MLKASRLWYMPITILMPVALLIQFEGQLLHLTDRIPGTSEQAAMVLWHTWWPQFGIRAPEELAINAYGGGPYLANHLAFMPIFQSLIFSSLQILGYPVLSVNLILILFHLLTQFMVYRYLIFRNVPLLLAGLASTALVLSAWYSNATARADVIATSLWLLPLTLYLWDKWLVHPTPVRLTAVVTVLYLAVLSGLQNLAWLVGVFLPYAIYTVLRLKQQASRDGLPDTGIDQHLSLAALVLTILLLIYPIPPIIRTLLGYEPAMGPTETSVTEHSLVGVVLRIDLVLTILGIAALVVARPFHEVSRWFYLFLYLCVVGTGLLPRPLQALAFVLNLPFQTLYDAQIFWGGAVFALTMLTSLGWSDLWTRRLERGYAQWIAVAGALIAILLVGELASNSSIRPLYTTPMRTYAFYSSLASESEDYYVLTYPNGLLSTLTDEHPGDEPHLFQYAVWHHKRSLGGIAPYYDPVIAANLSGMGFLYVDSDTPTDLETASSSMSAAIREWRIGYVVIHTDELTPETVSRIQELAAASDALCPPVQRENLVIYRALWHPYGCTN